MYYLIRYGIIILIAIICCALYFLLRIRKSRTIITIIIVAAIVSLFLYSFPFENLFYRFKTSDDVFSYLSNDKIVNTLEYDNFAAIVHSGIKGASQFAIMKKDSKGWFITDPSMSFGGESIFADTNFIDYTHLNDDIMFMYISIPVETESASPQIQDSNNTQFLLINQIGSTGGFKIYYAFVKYKKGYSVTIDGKMTLIN